MIMSMYRKMSWIRATIRLQLRRTEIEISEFHVSLNSEVDMMWFSILTRMVVVITWCLWYKDNGLWWKYTTLVELSCSVFHTFSTNRSFETRLVLCRAQFVDLIIFSYSLITRWPSSSVDHLSRTQTATTKQNILPLSQHEESQTSR